MCKFLEYGLGLKNKCFRCEYSKQKESNESPVEFVQKKPLSLDPVPSLHDQESSNLTSNSVQETSRKIAEKAHAEYQKAFLASSQCQNRKILLEREQKQLLNAFRVKSQLLSERNRILAHHEWQNLKQQFDAQQLGLKQFREFPQFLFDNPADAVDDKGETLAKANERINKMLKQVMQQLLQCEQIRAVKWKHYMKAKQEYELQL
ncbi:predicted protein [Chaetoceros tenuissimus]|uniref:Uncharacterized protein n=1 Tax=Chaetoceros tenuissimus TaxID=426638 RepID=A0AAD3HAI2_9STRA|nr:predicted protein [Chaetoceros tenuissimus]